MPVWLMILIAILALMATGAVVKLHADRSVGPQEITWPEYWAASALIALVVAPAVGWASTALALKSNVTFVEYWNGWETNARVSRTVCTRDGSCRWEYSCDPYTVMVPYECGTTQQPQTCYRSETHYHRCPYVTSEYAYYVDTTLGTYTIDSGRFPVNPDRHRWEPWRFERLPRSVIESAGTGEPPFWTRAKARLRSGNPGPVTKVNRYDNFVLASKRTILKAYRKAADEYRALRLMPPITATVRDFYRSDKVHLVGCSRSGYATWNDRVERLNAALGSELQGDVRLVLVCDPRINRNPDRYRHALEAHWQDTETWKRSALPKNTIVVIVGTTDQKTVAWGRAFTGMPVGNEAMRIGIQRRLMAARQVPWHPDAVVGYVTGRSVRSGDSYRSTSVRTSAVLTDVLWGRGNASTRFARVSMSAKDKGDRGTGFSYLARGVELTGWQKFFTLFFVCVFSAIAFSVVAFNDWFNAKGRF